MYGRFISDCLKCLSTGRPTSLSNNLGWDVIWKGYNCNWYILVHMLSRNDNLYVDQVNIQNGRHRTSYMLTNCLLRVTEQYVIPLF